MSLKHFQSKIKREEKLEVELSALKMKKEKNCKGRERRRKREEGYPVRWCESLFNQPWSRSWSLGGRVGEGKEDKGGKWNTSWMKRCGWLVYVWGKKKMKKVGKKMEEGSTYKKKKTRTTREFLTTLKKDRTGEWEWDGRRKCEWGRIVFPNSCL